MGGIKQKKKHLSLDMPLSDYELRSLKNCSSRLKTNQGVCLKYIYKCMPSECMLPKEALPTTAVVIVELTKAVTAASAAVRLAASDVTPATLL